MKTTDSLLHDHGRFRALLDALDAALAMPGDRQFVVRELCFSLCQRLRDHMRRELEVIGSCGGPLGSRELTALAEGHGDEAHSFRQILSSMTDGAPQPVDRSRGLLELAIVQLRYHLDVQEDRLYPALAWALHEDPPRSANAELAAALWG